MHGVLEVGVLVPEAVVAEVVAVIAPQHDYGSLAQAEPLEFGHHAPHLRIGIAGGGVVGADQLERLLVGNRALLGDIGVGAQLARIVQRDFRRALRREGVVRHA